MFRAKLLNDVSAVTHTVFMLGNGQSSTVRIVLD